MAINLPRFDSLSEAIVDLGAVAHNTKLIAKAVGRSQVMAVVKADAFGHGAIPVARTALAHGATWLGVTSQAEAIVLRRDGIDAPILMWLYGPNEDLGPAVKNDVHISVASFDHLMCVCRAAKKNRRPASIHLKVDTGLSRSGTPLAEWYDLVASAREFQKTGLVTITGVWSHLANAEDPSDPYLDFQVSSFRSAISTIERFGVAPVFYHIANSAASLQILSLHFDLVRAGAALYGIEPAKNIHFGLRPAMELRAQIILIKTVAAGTRVSYGSSYLTRRDTTLGLVSLGFADGIPRLAGKKASVLINGTRCPIVGCVAMDQFVVDINRCSAKVGDVAIVFGTGTTGEPLASDWALWAKTNSHEILTGIGNRVTRTYLRPEEQHDNY